jgi:hypothetical protein
LDDINGHLPLEIGQITELMEINIEDSDLSAGAVPDSIGLCTKLVKVVLVWCKLQGGVPVGLRELKSLGMYDYNYLNEIEELVLYKNNFSGSIPAWIGSLNLLNYLSLWGNELSGELPIGICNLYLIKWMILNENTIEGISSL